MLVLRFAPRYDDRLFEILALLDDPSLPIAEVCRRVGDAGERIGLIRPSYVHLRRLILLERARADAARERRAEVRRITRMLIGLLADAYDVADRIEHVVQYEKLVAQSHKVSAVRRTPGTEPRLRRPASPAP